MQELDRGSWMERVPDLLQRGAVLWDLQVGPQLPAGYFARVYACMDARGRELVLKLSPPDAPAELEAAALRLWDGQGAVRLLAHDLATGALLMERVVPGAPLPPGEETAAVAAAASVLRQLHRAQLPAAHPFPSLEDYVDRQLQRTRREAAPGTVGIRLLEDSRRLAMQLWTTSQGSVLLHGDFIDKNLLLGPSGYLAIDPMPAVGDPGADIGMFASFHPPARHITTRARALALDLGHDPDRAERWAFFYAIGEACETWREDSDELREWVAARAETIMLRGDRAVD